MSSLNFQINPELQFFIAVVVAEYLYQTCWADGQISPTDRKSDLANLQSGATSLPSVVFGTHCSMSHRGRARPTA